MHVTGTAEKGAEMSSKVANFLKGISLVLGIDADGTRVPLCRHSPPKMLRDARMAGLVKL